MCAAALRASGAVEVTSSEENTAEADAGGVGYSVAYDPLDGSSIISAGWAVGAIFAIFPGRGLVGRPGRDQAAAAYALFGSRTLLVIARPVAGAAAPHAAVSVTAKGDLAFLFLVSATDKQWAKNADMLRAVAKTFKA